MNRSWQPFRWLLIVLDLREPGIGVRGRAYYSCSERHGIHLQLHLLVVTFHFYCEAWWLQ